MARYKYAVRLSYCAQHTLEKEEAMGRELTKKAIMGSPTKASAVLSFRLFPPLQQREQLCCHGDDLCTRSIPVGTAQPSGMLGQVQSLHLPVHRLVDVGLRDAPQSGKQGKVFPTCQTIDEGIKLGTVTNPLLDLKGVGEIFYDHMTSCDIM